MMIFFFKGFCGYGAATGQFPTVDLREKKYNNPETLQLKGGRIYI